MTSRLIAKSGFVAAVCALLPLYVLGQGILDPYFAESRVGIVCQLSVLFLYCVFCAGSFALTMSATTERKYIVIFYLVSNIFLLLITQPWDLAASAIDIVLKFPYRIWDVTFTVLVSMLSFIHIWRIIRFLRKSQVSTL